jgi:hypothetical protein
VRDTDAVATAQRQARYLVDGVTPDDQRQLAMLAIMLVITHRDTMSPVAIRQLDEVLATLAPDVLLTLRAIRETARHATRGRRNWRPRS